MEFVFSRRKLTSKSDINSVLMTLLGFYVYFLAHLPLIVNSDVSNTKIYFYIYFLFSLNLLIIKKHTLIRDNCIKNVFIFNFIINPLSLYFLPNSCLILIPYFFSGIPLNILLKKTKNQIFFGSISLLFKISFFYLFSKITPFEMQKNTLLSIYELSLFSIYFYFILIFLRITNRNIKKDTSMLTNLAVIDDLTQLYNRRYLSNIMGLYTRDCAIGLVDIDEFKKINDNYGHQIGDKALIRVSKVFKNYQYSRLSVIRFGGDEFLFLLENGTISELASILETIRKIIEKMDFEQDIPEGITISCGISQCTNGQAWNKIIEKTDKALYNAKLEGRNRICYLK
ncbi:MAG: GGDEF domain-containing protein [Spirochaetia bacterium]|nr:GGDEF domain-containing protein [Spirochaetia bacterium]